MTVTVLAPTQPKERLSERSFFIDVFKAIGCILIVLHHLAFYGPMADVVAKAWPGSISWLSQHARLAVYMFLACSGFLTAQTVLTLPSLSLGQVLQRTAQRYLRLVGPLLAALSLTVLINPRLGTGSGACVFPSAPPGAGGLVCRCLVRCG
jgi:peptidoglycan/LPS O-acetylase OafA/YrhL